MLGAEAIDQVVIDQPMGRPAVHTYGVEKYHTLETFCFSEGRRDIAHMLITCSQGRRPRRIFSSFKMLCPCAITGGGLFLSLNTGCLIGLPGLYTASVCSFVIALAPMAALLFNKSLLNRVFAPLDVRECGNH